MAKRETVRPNHGLRMFVLIWGTLLSSGASVLGRQHCHNEHTQYCITLSEAVLKAEAGLCVVIPCSFTTAPAFTTQHLVWYKCAQSKSKCEDSDVILNTTKLNKGQSLFKGRISLLEPDVSQGNCSIIINDLTESDSGAYQFRVGGLLNINKADGWTYLEKAAVSVKGLSQKPSVMIPSLTDGQQTTLTCTAPVLCSGSNPKFTWTWRGAGVKDSQITGNITAFKTENLTAVTQRHSSTLTFNPAAEHHNSSVTCEVSFTNNITAEETVTLNVTFVKEPLISGITIVKDGDDLNLTCSVESFPPCVITWTIHGSNKNLSKETKIIVHSDTGTATLILRNIKAEYSGLYVCTATHQIPTLSSHAEVNVTYLKKPVIIGRTTVKEGDDLNLTCSVESFPSCDITWTKHGSQKALSNETKIIVHNGTGTATLTISDGTADHSGLYVCTATHQIPPLSMHAEVNVTFVKKPVITGNTTIKEGDDLHLTCSVRSFPPSVMAWTKHGLVKNLTKQTKLDLHNDTRTATLIIHNVTLEYSGLYVCTATHQIPTLSTHAEVNVTFHPRIFSTSGCVVQSEVLTCVCITDGFPLPTIKWPLLDAHTEYSVTTNFSNHTVNVSFTVSVKDRNYTTVECISRNYIGEAKENLNVTKINVIEYPLHMLFTTFNLLPLIIVFLIGLLASTSIYCCARKCHSKRKNSEEIAETLEMISAGEAVQNDGNQDKEEAEGGAVAPPNGDVEPKEVVYSDIDFSLLERKGPKRPEATQESTETEYAEVKKKGERPDNGAKDGEMVDGNQEEKVKLGDDKEGEQCMSAEEGEGGQDVALYSNLNEIMGEV
ncbi:sialic acid-binding Ig-like lectin 10 isoform X2 [Eleginops maclovinus]|uniref:sialic acid-binding Ig-like lectin 10 isoform X2 n=1 Tax=Eleginops maclovinus TaxID=56733 RepID=UPI00308008CA